MRKNSIQLLNNLNFENARDRKSVLDHCNSNKIEHERINIIYIIYIFTYY